MEKYLIRNVLLLGSLLIGLAFPTQTFAQNAISDTMKMVAKLTPVEILKHDSSSYDRLMKPREGVSPKTTDSYVQEISKLGQDLSIKLKKDTLTLVLFDGIAQFPKPRTRRNSLQALAELTQNAATMLSGVGLFGYKPSLVELEVWKQKAADQIGLRPELTNPSTFDYQRQCLAHYVHAFMLEQYKRDVKRVGLIHDLSFQSAAAKFAPIEQEDKNAHFLPAWLELVLILGGFLMGIAGLLLPRLRKSNEDKVELKADNSLRESSPQIVIKPSSKSGQRNKQSKGKKNRGGQQPKTEKDKQQTGAIESVEKQDVQSGPSPEEIDQMIQNKISPLLQQINSLEATIKDLREKQQEASMETIVVEKAVLEEQAKEPSKQAVPVVTTKTFYSAQPNKGVFYHKKMGDKLNTSLHIYELILDMAAGEGEYKLINNPAVQSRAFNLQDTILNPAMDIIGSGEIKAIKSQTPGKLLKDNQNWRIIERAKLEY